MAWTDFCLAIVQNWAWWFSKGVFTWIMFYSSLSDPIINHNKNNWSRPSLQSWQITLSHFKPAETVSSAKRSLNVAFGRLIFFRRSTFSNFWERLHPMGSYPNFFMRIILALTKSFSASVRLTLLNLGSCMLKDELRTGDSAKSERVILGTSDHEMRREFLRIWCYGYVLLRSTRLINKILSIWKSLENMWYRQEG